MQRIRTRRNDSLLNSISGINFISCSWKSWCCLPFLPITLRKNELLQTCNHKSNLRSRLSFGKARQDSSSCLLVSQFWKLVTCQMLNLNLALGLLLLLQKSALVYRKQQLVLLSFKNVADNGTKVLKELSHN